MSDNEIRAQLAVILHKQGAYCGVCDYESPCWDCDRVLESYANAILANPELLDKLTTFRQAMRLAEHGAGDTPQDRWRGASRAARASEHHWAADCLAEAADVLDSMNDWRPPARVITDAADLDALPIMSVVLAYGVAHQAIPGLGSVRLAWVKPTGQSAQSSAELLAATRGKGVTVLYEPEEDR